MNDEEWMGDTDPNNLPEDEGQAQPQGADQGGDGLPGVAIQGDPDWRAGAFAHGSGLLGLIKVSDRKGADDIPPGYTAVGDGSKYMQDAQGNYQFTPAYGRKIHNGQTDWGNVDWRGVGLDLGSIAAGSLPLVGAGPSTS